MSINDLTNTFSETIWKSLDSFLDLYSYEILEISNQSNFRWSPLLQNSGHFLWKFQRSENLDKARGVSHRFQKTMKIQSENNVLT